MDAFKTPSPDPEQQALGRELESVLQASVEALPVSYRTVFMLREIEGLTVEQPVQQHFGDNDLDLCVRVHGSVARDQPNAVALEAPLRGRPPLAFSGPGLASGAPAARLPPTRAPYFSELCPPYGTWAVESLE